MILTETQKAWRKMEIEEIIEEHRIACSNERLWAKGSNTPEQAAMHEANVNEHLSYIAYLNTLLDEEYNETDGENDEYEEYDMDGDIIKDVDDILPVNVTILASQLQLDTDDIADDEEELAEEISDYLSDTYGFCHKGFNFEVVRNENGESSEFVVTDINWDTTD
jgi:hypothetical protein